MFTFQKAAGKDFQLESPSPVQSVRLSWGPVSSACSLPLFGIAINMINWINKNKVK